MLSASFNYLPLAATTTAPSLPPNPMTERFSIQQIFNPAFWQQTFQDAARWAIALIPQIVVAILLLILFYIANRIIRRIVGGAMRRAHIDSGVSYLLMAILRWTILGVGLVMALNQVGIQIAALLAGVSIIGLAIGLAAQDTLSNFIAGVVILWDRPFRIGDWVTVDDQYGRVERVSLRSTRILNLDGDMVVVPNSAVVSNRLTNHSANSVLRVNVPIGLPASMSVDHARSVLLPLTKSDNRIEMDPPPSVVVDSIAGGAANIILRFWIKDESQERSMYHEYLEKAKNVMDQAK